MSEHSHCLSPQSQANPCGICVGKSSTGAGFAPSISIFASQHHCTISHSIICLLMLHKIRSSQHCQTKHSSHCADHNILPSLPAEVMDIIISKQTESFTLILFNILHHGGGIE
jgi:hypothetical protein